MDEPAFELEQDKSEDLPEYPDRHTASSRVPVFCAAGCCAAVPMLGLLWSCFGFTAAWYNSAHLGQLEKDVWYSVGDTTEEIAEAVPVQAFLAVFAISVSVLILIGFTLRFIIRRQQQKGAWRNH